MSSLSKANQSKDELSKNNNVGQNPISWFIFGLMASVTFIGILSELMPSGILPQMTVGLGIEQTQVGFLVGIYALASAIFAIPLISMTLWVNRKILLLMLLAGFAVSNIVVGLTSSYSLIVAMRILGGICAGIMWPMIAAYGTALVPENMHGKAITIIMAGNTFGVSLGLPIMTFIGTQVGWRTSFIVLGVLGGGHCAIGDEVFTFGKGRETDAKQFPNSRAKNTWRLDSPSPYFLGSRCSLQYLHLHYLIGRNYRLYWRHQLSPADLRYRFCHLSHTIRQDYRYAPARFDRQYAGLWCNSYGVIRLLQRNEWLLAFCLFTMGTSIRTFGNDVPNSSQSPSHRSKSCRDFRTIKCV
ncbi:MFS transporter [Psychrobacter sp. T6-1]|uniref:MFS transporter n=1 Tax=Psychrobacter sp. T6-1 TaxID=3457447 RepID=UPI003FCF987C